MRILVVGYAAIGELKVGDRFDGEGRQRHLVDVLTDEEFGGPHDVFTCTTFDQAVRYLRGLAFDRAIVDGPLGYLVLEWIAGNVPTLLATPKILAVGRIADDPAFAAALDAAQLEVKRLDAVLADRIRTALI